MPLKAKLKNFDEDIKDLKKELSDNKKLCHMIRSECGSLEHLSKILHNDLLKETMHDIGRLDRELKRIQATNTSDTSSLKQQAHQLNSEKIKIQQNVILLTTNLSNIESEIGFEIE
jgi:chromosome segregation ATPase